MKTGYTLESLNDRIGIDCLELRLEKIVARLDQNIESVQRQATRDIGNLQDDIRRIER